VLVPVSAHGFAKDPNSAFGVDDALDDGEGQRCCAPAGQSASPSPRRGGPACRASG
jgi:hypothetical protein